jgi:hypothetical protein
MFSLMLHQLIEPTERLGGSVASINVAKQSEVAIVYIFLVSLQLVFAWEGMLAAGVWTNKSWLCAFVLPKQRFNQC